ncbi:MAG: YbaK/EbsC family protein [Patescibacteria group bacterium]|nr:YbaK/EbsC family protein [Patescibacteria group bacterium]
MPISQKLLKFINSAKIKYEPIEHRTVYTAYDKAATLRVPQKIIAKTLVVKLEKTLALVLIPANKNLDIQKLKKIANVKKVDFIKEAWMKKNLKGVKVGAIPPFGNLWGLPTFADKTLLKEPKIIINAGDYNWSIKITPAVFKKLIPNLVIGSFSTPKK